MAGFENVVAAKILEVLTPEMQRELAVEYVKSNINIRTYAVTKKVEEVITSECERVVETHRDEIAHAARVAIETTLADKGFIDRFVLKRRLRKLCNEILKQLDLMR